MHFLHNAFSDKPINLYGKFNPTSFSFFIFLIRFLSQ